MVMILSSAFVVLSGPVVYKRSEQQLRPFSRQKMANDNGGKQAGLPDFEVSLFIIATDLRLAGSQKNSTTAQRSSFFTMVSSLKVIS